MRVYIGERSRSVELRGAHKGGGAPTPWYVSNVSIIFDCSMLLYYLFCMLMGFILHFYIIFGTNLLTGGPTQIAVFFAYFRVSKKRKIKRSPNGMKPSGTWFSQQTWSRRLRVGVKKQGRKARGRGRAYPPGAPSTLVVPPLLHRRTSSCYIYPRTPKHPGAPRNLIPPPQPSVLERSHLEAFSGAPPEGASITEGLYINSMASPVMCE